MPSTTAEAPRRIYPTKISVYITEQRLRERLKAFAAEHRWSESQAALILIEQGLEREDQVPA